MPCWKNPTSIYLDDMFCLEVCSIYEFHEAALDSYLERAKRLDEWWSKELNGDREDWLIDQNVVVADIKRRIGYAVATMLCSAAEDALVDGATYCGYTKKTLQNEFRKSMLESSALLHKKRFRTDFETQVTVTSRSVRPLPSGLRLDQELIDFELLKGFVWARNAIVHDLGLVCQAEAAKFHVPIESQDTSSGDPESNRFRRRLAHIEIADEYLAKVTKNLVGYVDRIAENLRIDESS